MHYRRLGRSGLKVSEISLGSWINFGGQVDEKVAAELVRAAYDQGVNYFDNADSYANGQSEIIMGKAVRGLPREGLILSSKVFWPTMPGPNGRGLSGSMLLNRSMLLSDARISNTWTCIFATAMTPTLLSKSWSG